MKKVFLILLSFYFATSFAQNRDEDVLKTTNFPKMRKLEMTDIPGAPKLKQPVYLKGTTNEIRIEKHGLIYPAFFDWNKDGKKDLMLGEFETGDEGSYIKVYLNVGSKEEPSYTGEYFYATDVNGDTITNHQWCCIGIHPRIVDMDGDGYLDILSGQYNPGLISWWRGSKNGFQPRQLIDQQGYVEGKRYAMDKEPWSPEAWAYWNYTSADFADFDGDGLLDLFVGGTDGFRVALNIGTKEKPKFAVRKYLHHVNGDILNVEKPSEEKINAERSEGRYPNMSGAGKGYMNPVDWDNDGVLDLLVTHGYYKKGHNPIEFFHGVNTDKGLRFEQAKPIFTESKGRKAMPGCQPMITVTDYNNDGIKDIVMGISIPAINGYEIAPEVAWKWVKDLEIEMPGKDAGRNIVYDGGVEGAIKRIESDTIGWTRKYYLGNLDDYKYLTMRHRGYAFVFLGKKNSEKARAVTKTAEPAVENLIVKNETSKASEIDGPVNYRFSMPKWLKFGEETEISVQFKLKKDWYLYADHAANTSQGFIPTVVSIEFDSDKIEKLGELEIPIDQPKGGFKIYKGDKIIFKQKFKLNHLTEKEWRSGKYDEFNSVKAKLKIRFQTCNNQLCLPPETVTEELEIKIKMY